MRGMLNRLYGLMAGLNFIGSLWIAVLMVLITTDVLGRALFNEPLYGVPEIVKVSIVGLVWLQMAHTVHIGGHLRSRLILDRVPSGVRAALELLAFFLGSIVFTLIVVSAWDNMIVAWELGEFEGERPVRVPTAPIHTIVIVGAALTAIQFTILTIRQARRVAAGEGDADNGTVGGGLH